MPCKEHRDMYFKYEYKEITKSEVMRIPNKMKSGKSPRIDGSTSELLKKVGNCVIKCLVQFYDVSWKQCLVPKN